MTSPATRSFTAPQRVSPRLARLLAIPAHRRSHGLLEGEWAAVFPGRSHDFDDLRPYVPGDDVRDIDWRATARGGAPLVKRYVARRELTLLLLVPTGRELAAAGPDGVAKVVAAQLVAEVLAGISAARGDGVALVAGRPGAATVLPARRGPAHRARLVSALTADLGDPPVDVTGLLAHAARVVRRRALAVVVADDVDVDAGLERAVRRLAVQHEVLWVTVSDADPTTSTGAVRAVPGHDGPAREGRARAGWARSRPAWLPVRARRDPRVRTAHAAAEAERRRRNTAALRRSGVSVGRVDGVDGVVGGLRALVAEHGRALR